MIEEFYELQNRITLCDFERCPYKGSWKDEKLPEHRLPDKWTWWFKNKLPSEKEAYYVLFNYTGGNGVIVTLRPTTGWIIDTADLYLAHALKRLGLASEKFTQVEDTFVFYESKVLVTDLVKCRGKAREKIRKLPEPCLEFLKKELDLVKKTSGKNPAVIAMGRKTRRLLEKHKSQLGINHPVPQIPFHNSVYTTQRKKYGETAEERINNYAEIIRKAFIAAGLPIPRPGKQPTNTTKTPA